MKKGGRRKKLIEKIISGGQTGVDRAALDLALKLGIPCGGWCPKGRRAEDGPIDARYPLKETNSAQYQVRTEKNVMDTDGTLILTVGLPTGGTAFTIKMAEKHEKPHLLVDLGKETDAIAVREWVETHNIQVLNVAGPRESKCPGIHDNAMVFLRRILKEG